jgi:hypothetical protein
MVIKESANGTYTLVDDGSSIITWNSLSSNATIGVNNTAYDSMSTVSSIQSTIEKITKEPEVREDQRSSLEITGRQISARYYKDGFYTDSKNLIPAIQSIEVFNNNTVKITFVNGDVQKSTAQNGDAFSLEDGILRCITKEMIGKEGNAILNKLMDYAIKTYEAAEAEKKKKADEEEKKRIASEKNYKKAKKHWAKKRAMERENRIQEMAEAIVRAEEMKKR